MTRLRLPIGLVSCLLALPGAAGAAQTDSAELLVSVVDQTGGVLPTALVTLTSEDAADAPAILPLLTSDVGEVRFEGLAPGRYTVQVDFQGFETTRDSSVRVRAGRNRRLVSLRLLREEEVDVIRDRQSEALDFEGSAFSNVLTRELIDQLPDDPEALKAALEAMAPPGARFRIDGFEGGTLPPKAQIRSIRVPRIDQNAAENHGGRGGFVFIDIRTRPGGGPLRGRVTTTFFDEALSARNPFTPVKGDEQTQRGDLYLSGSIVPGTTGFSLTAGGASQFTSPTLLAVAADGTTVADALRQPTDNLRFGVRVDHALNPEHALRISYDRGATERRGLGIGGYNLPERGFRSTTTSNVVRVAENGPVGQRMFTESRLELSWLSTDSGADVESPAIRVIDAFTSGGAQVQGGQRAFEIEAATDLDYIVGAHSWRVGTLIEGGRYESDDLSNYLGTYTFASLNDFNTGRPSTFTRRIGDPDVTYSAWRTGAYLQDDWRVSRSLLLSAGLRAGFQTLVDDQVNLSPRVTVGWAPLGDGTLTVRAAYGYLYDWVEGSLFKQTLLVDGFRLRELNVVAPSYPEMPAAGPSTVTNRYLWSDDLSLEASHRVNLGVERDLTANTVLNASYTLGWGDGLLRGRNLNPPADGVRPDPVFANVVALVADARLKTHTVSLGWDLIRFDLRELFFTAGYSWNKSDSNTTGPFALPANGDDLETEWGPTTARHTANAYFSVQPVDNLGVDLRFSARSGAPYNITTGRDDNLDGLFTDRPGGVPRNSARTAAHVDLSGGVSYRWRYGPATPGGDGEPVQRRLVELSLSFENLLNRDNFIGYSGVMTSPFFLQPTDVLSTRRGTLRLRVEL